MNDSLDYTPEQALADATEATQKADYDGAIVILLRNIDGSEADITHFMSGVRGMQIVSVLEVLKTRVSLGVLGY